MIKRSPKLMIGWREAVSLPDLGLDSFSAKIDTGARTTAIHANGIKTYEINGKPWTEFTPDHTTIATADRCVLPVHHMRPITNTSGIPDDRRTHRPPASSLHR